MIHIRKKILLILFSLAWTCASASETLCTSAEQIIFSCASDRASKIVSLCASNDFTAKTGMLYYRFGTPQKVELEYPGTSDGNTEQFRFAHYSRFQTELTEVNFSIGKYSYTVFDYYDESEKVKYQRGVRVTGAKDRESTFSCKGKATSALHRLEGKLPCDEGNALAQCN